MSQSSQLMRLCMPLTKFSYANAPASSIGPIPWTHISSTNNLFVLIEPNETRTQQGVSEKRYRFRVLQDPNVHEDFDLSLLAEEARRAIDEAQVSIVPDQQPSITVIVRSPCIAMRYPAQERQVRRFQVRFAKEEDYYETLRLFSIVKVPFVEAGTVSKPQVVPLPSTHTMVSSNITSNHAAQNNLEPQTRLSQQHDNLSATTSTAGPRDVQRSQDAARPISNGIFHPTQTFSLSRHSEQRLPGTYSEFRSVAPGPSMPSINYAHDTRMSANQIIPRTYSLPSSSISTYVPRPSTAPSNLNLSYSSDLPPKRDLPFQRKSKALPTSAPVSIVGKDTNEASITAPETLVNDSTPHTIPVAPTKQASVARNRKRAAPKVQKAPATKKPRTNTIRKKGTGSKTPEDQVVSTVEQLLQQHDSQPHSELETQQHIDTQALLDKAEAIQILRQTRSKANRGSPSTVPEDNSRVTEELANSHTPREEGITRKAPYHTRSQSTNIRRQVSQSQTSNEPERARNNNPQQIASDNTTNTAPQPEPQTIPPPQPRPSALKLLLSDPNFAQPASITLPNPGQAQSSTPTSTATHMNFDDLRESDRHAALEAWMIQTLKDDSFLGLCKTMDGVWQRVFVNI